MRNRHHLPAALLATVLLSPLAATAQQAGPNLPPGFGPGGQFRGQQPMPDVADIDRALLVAYREDLEAILADLSRVTEANSAKAYEAYFSGQLPRYAQNIRALNRAIRRAERLGRAGKPVTTQARAVIQEDAALTESHVNRIEQAMVRAEGLNPGLTPLFDRWRALDD